jgi:hypothetical protein
MTASRQRVLSSMLLAGLCALGLAHPPQVAAQMVTGAGMTDFKSKNTFLPYLDFVSIHYQPLAADPALAPRHDS